MLSSAGSIGPAESQAGTASEAVEFLRQLRAERGEHGPAEDRINEVRAQIEATGTYWQTEDELVWGAKIAWRNTPGASASSTGRVSPSGTWVT